METDLTPRQALSEVERATASLWTEYPPTPWWYYPTVGAWSGAFVFTVSELWQRPAVFVPVVLVLVALEGAFIRRMQEGRGAWPKLGSAPPEFVPAIRAYFAGLALLIVAAGSIYVVAGSVAAAVFTAVFVATGLLVYERAYANAAEATRARLS